MNNFLFAMHCTMFVLKALEKVRKLERNFEMGPRKIGFVDRPVCVIQETFINVISRSINSLHITYAYKLFSPSKMFHNNAMKQ
jgi:hypothetical protein